MKKWGLLISVLLLLTGCNNGKDNPETPLPSPSSTPTPTAESNDPHSASLRALCTKMEEKETVVGITFVGQFRTEQEFNAILTDFSGYEGMDFVNDIPPARQIRQSAEKEEKGYLAFVVVPTKYTDSLAVNSYDEVSARSGEVFYRSDDPEVLLLITPEDAGRAHMHVVVVGGEGAEILPKLSLSHSRLEVGTRYSIYDFTPADVYRNQPLPHYSQSCFDRIFYRDEVTDAVEKGVEIGESYDVSIEGYPAIAYPFLQDGEVKFYYAANPQGHIYRADGSGEVVWEKIN